MAIDRTALRALATPRVINLMSVAFLYRIAYGGTPLALLVALNNTYGIGIAAFIDGIYTLLLALLGPLRARMLDRFGQKTALLAMGPASVGFMCLIIWGIAEHWWWPLVLVLVIAAGMTIPPLNAAVRVSWRYTVQGEAALKTVHSVDSVVEELAFFIGPALAGLGFYLAGPHHTYRYAVAGMAVGLAAFAAVAWRYRITVPVGQTHEEPAAGHSSSRRAALRRWLGPLTDPAMPRIMAPLLVMGIMFGGMNIYIAAWTQAEGILGWSGLIAVQISLGGVIGGLIMAATRWEPPLWTRYRLMAIGFLVPYLALVLAHSPWVLAGIFFTAGLFMTPLFATAFLLIDAEIPLARRHEATAWVGSSTDLANGITAIVLGLLIAQQRWQLVLTILTGIAALCLLYIVLARRARSGQAQQQAEPVTAAIL